jgi:hypothetical protein
MRDLSLGFKTLNRAKKKYLKEAGGRGGSAFCDLAATEGEGGLTVCPRGGLEVNIGGQL